MPARRNHTSPHRRRSRRRFTITKMRRFARRRWREGRVFIRALWAAHPVISLPVSAILVLVLWLAVNWTYHALKKPTEVFFPLDNVFDKNLAETWQEYGTLFREHATAVISPELLAALAQMEGGGNPVARTYWRWHSSWNPLGWYEPASSAVGMYQITSGTFQAGKRYCIHDHVVVEEGPWHDLRSCWFNGFYMRILPSHAIELTAALLDREVSRTVSSGGGATIQRKQDLAALIHLCGASAGRRYVVRGYRLTAGQRCGDHDVRTYLARVNALKRQFAQLAAGNQRIRTRG